MTTDISKLDSQIAELQSKKKALLDEQRDTKLNEVKAIILQFGFTAVDLGISTAKGRKPKGKASTTPKVKLQPKYANPRDSAITWHGGRGAKPKWVKEFLEGGGKLESLLIKK